MSHRLQLPDEVARHLGPFYVGKGTGQRLTTHGNSVDAEPDPGEQEKSRRMREIRDAGLEPQIDLVRHGIATEAHAFDIEAALIDTLPGLVNRVRGQDVERGRQCLDELVRLSQRGEPVPGP